MNNISTARLAETLRYLAIAMNAEEASFDADTGDALTVHEQNFVTMAFDAARKEQHPPMPPVGSVYSYLALSDFEDVDLLNTTELEDLLESEREAVVRDFWELYQETIEEDHTDVMDWMVEVYAEEIAAIGEWYRENH